MLREGGKEFFQIALALAFVCMFLGVMFGLIDSYNGGDPQGLWGLPIVSAFFLLVVLVPFSFLFLKKKKKKSRR